MFAKYYAFLIVCVFITYTQQQIKDPEFLKTVAAYKVACLKETGIEQDYLTKVMKENHFPTDNQKLKCFFKCMSVKLGIISPAGEVIDDVLKKVAAHFVDAATDEEIVTECGGIEGADLCETAFKLAACVKAAELD